MDFYDHLFLSILTALLPLTKHSILICCLECKTITVRQRISFVIEGRGGGSTLVLKIFFLFPI